MTSVTFSEVVAYDCGYRAGMIEGARLMQENAAGVAGEYSADAWDAIINIDPAAIVKGKSDE